MNFHVGQRVICIKGWRGFGKFNRPKLHNIYTIRAWCPAAAEPSLLFCELSNREVIFAVTKKLGEASFAASHFRALYDISELEALLQKEPINA